MSKYQALGSDVQAAAAAPALVRFISKQAIQRLGSLDVLFLAVNKGIERYLCVFAELNVGALVPRMVRAIRQCRREMTMAVWCAIMASGVTGFFHAVGLGGWFSEAAAGLVPASGGSS